MFVIHKFSKIPALLPSGQHECNSCHHSIAMIKKTYHSYWALKFFIVSVLASCFLIACSSSRPSKSPQDQKSLSKEELAKMSGHREAGIDFVANGNLPSAWSLYLDFDKDFRFYGEANEVYISNAVKPVLNNSEKQLFEVKTTAGKMQIIIYAATCEQGQKVEVDIAGKLYSGCGAYQADRRLSGEWTLRFIDQELLDDTDYPNGLPVIRIDGQLTNGQVFDGCNQYKVQVMNQGDRIRLTNWNGTKKSCPTIKTVDLFQTWLTNKLVNFRLEEDMLTLYLQNDSRLLFRKK